MCLQYKWPKHPFGSPRSNLTLWLLARWSTLRPSFSKVKMPSKLIGSLLEDGLLVYESLYVSLLSVLTSVIRFVVLTIIVRKDPFGHRTRKIRSSKLINVISTRLPMSHLLKVPKCYLGEAGEDNRDIVDDNAQSSQNLSKKEIEGTRNYQSVTLTYSEMTFCK